jgi:hypothetical protein
VPMKHLAALDMVLQFRARYLWAAASFDETCESYARGKAVRNIAKAPRVT